MRNKKRISLLLAVLLLVAAGALVIGPAYARYREVLTGDPAFQVNPAEQLAIADQQWQQVEDTYVLTFTMEKTSPDCRVFLAMSEGVHAPEAVTVTLTLPGAEPVDLQATAATIPAGTPLYRLFGPGSVFRFVDADTGEEAVLDLATQPYTVTVHGLSQAAQQASLLRLFVERVHE
ncbi:MAG: hypothetical protein IJC33_07845 [Clostridia bacterium]|nr:hypothetical protein [Clostridia bacterium]